MEWDLDKVLSSFRLHFLQHLPLLSILLLLLLLLNHHTGEVVADANDSVDSVTALTTTMKWMKKYILLFSFLFLIIFYSIFLFYLVFFSSSVELENGADGDGRRLLLPCSLSLPKTLRR